MVSVNEKSFAQNIKQLNLQGTKKQLVEKPLLFDKITKK